MLLFTIAVVTVLVISFLCSIFESVLLSINHAQVEALSRRHAAAGRLMSGFKRNIDVPIAAILILNTAAHTIGAAVAGATYSQVFNAETLWIFTLVFTLLVLLFTEIVPKTLGVTYTTVLAAPVAWGIRLLTLLLRPLVIVSESLSSRLRHGRDVPVTSVEEIRLLAALGRNEGIVGVHTADMIVGVTLLRKLRAMDVMLTRQKVAFLSATQSRQQVLDTISETRFSRFPFSPTGALEDATGMVLARELLLWVQDHPEQEIDWSAVVTDVLLVPNSTPLHQLLKTFQEKRRHLALVVDEFGDIDGIVTLEDVIEEVMGEIDDESDEPSYRLRQRPDGSWHIRADTELRRVCSALGLEWMPEDEVSSLGGLINERLGHIPKPGDSIDWRGYRLHVVLANERHAELVRITAGQDS